MAHHPLLLDRLSSLPGVDAVAQIARDGSLIRSHSRLASDATKDLCALVKAGFEIHAGCGGAGPGSNEEQFMAVFDDGLLMSAATHADGLLAVVTNPTANLGRVRFQIKRELAETRNQVA